MQPKFSKNDFLRMHHIINCQQKAKCIKYIFTKPLRKKPGVFLSKIGAKNFINLTHFIQS